MGEVRNAHVERRSSELWMVSRAERNGLVVDKYAGRPCSLLGNIKAQ